MKVCSIERHDGVIRVDGVVCGSANDAYLLFRDKYNRSLGKATHKRLGHVGQRNERITDVGIHFEQRYSEALRKEFDGNDVVDYRVIGLFGPSYCRIFGAGGIESDEDCDRIERYIDWLLASGMKNTRLRGRKDKITRILTDKHK